MRAAVVGMGRMGAFANPNVRRYSPACWWPLSHGDAIETIPGISLTAICDTSEAQLRAGLERFPSAAGYSSVAEMLRTESLDLVTVATRTIERSDIIGKILAAGVKALHIEKPLCNTVAQLVALEGAFRDPNLRLSYGTIRRYMPVYQGALEIVESAQYGPLESIQIEFGRAALMWTHPHSLDLILFFAGARAIERVSAHFVPGSVAVNGVAFDGDPVVSSILVEFDDGVIGTIGPAGNCDARLRCKDGLVSVESDGDALRVRFAEDGDWYWRRSETLATGDEPGGTGFAIRRLLPPANGRAVVDSGRDKSAMVDGQRLLFACLQSHLEGGRPVSLNQIDPSLSINGRNGERFA